MSASRAIACALLALGAASGCGDDAEAAGPASIQPWAIPAVATARGRLPPKDAPAVAGSMSSPPAGTGAAHAPPTVVDLLDEDGGLPASRAAIFDPNEVYLFGHVEPRDCEHQVVARIEPRLRGIAGFPCDAVGESAQVRPSDGRLLYRQTTGGLRTFHCDVCSYGRRSVYPEDPAANDPEVPWPCDPSGAPVRFAIAPDGRTFHRCTDDWYDDAGTLLPTGDAGTILSFGHGATALGERGVVELASGRVSAFSGWPELQPLAQRAREDGYWIVFGRQREPELTELWRVGFDGVAERLGEYPALGALRRPRTPPKLDGQGRLYDLFLEAGGSDVRPMVTWRSIDGSSAVIYDEPGDAEVTGRSGSLFTGP